MKTPVLPGGDELFYDSARRGSAVLEEAVALWRFRHLVRELISRDIKVRYKRSALGVVWTMLSPLLTMVALTFAFSAILRQQVANYPVYFMTGSLLWNFFAQTTGHTANLTTDAMEMTKRIYLPRSVFVAAAVGGALVNLLLALIPLGLIMVATGFPIHATWLFLPVPILLGAVFTAGISLLVFTLACRFVDVRETYLVLVSTWFFATPIVYTAAIVPPKYQPILQANPMTHLVAVFRAPLYDGRLPDPATFGKAFLASLLALLLGWLFYASKIENYGSGR